MKLKLTLTLTLSLTLSLVTDIVTITGTFLLFLIIVGKRERSAKGRCRSTRHLQASFGVRTEKERIGREEETTAATEGGRAERASKTRAGQYYVYYQTEQRMCRVCCFAMLPRSLFLFSFFALLSVSLLFLLLPLLLLLLLLVLVSPANRRKLTEERKNCNNASETCS